MMDDDDEISEHIDEFCINPQQNIVVLEDVKLGTVKVSFLKFVFIEGSHDGFKFFWAEYTSIYFLLY